MIPDHSFTRLASLMFPEMRVCGRPKKKTGEPCLNRMKAHHAACYSHMNEEERDLSRQDDLQRQHEATTLRRKFNRGPLFRFLRWRSSLPDLATVAPAMHWDVFLDAHEDRCAVCRSRAKRTVIDHDHTTGLVRGILCPSCNAHAASGMPHINFRQFDDVRPAIALYCQYPPAAVMGLRETYAHPFGREAASSVRSILWHVGPDGVEHDRIVRLGPPKNT